MKKIESQKILIKDIKYIENSRMRGKSDVSDLMHDIEQNGLLSNIGIRKEDNAIIYGNRRALAFEKLGYKEIPCDIYEDVSDEDIIILNLVENIKRKQIGSIEIGRMCKILQDRGYTTSEISIKLDISKSRVQGSISAYNVTIGTPFESLVGFGKSHKNRGISELLIWKIQNSLGRALGKKITKNQWDLLLRACENGELNTKNLSVLRYILLSDKDKNIPRALAILDKTRVVYAYLSVNREEYDKAKAKAKISNDVEFINHIIKEYNEDLIF